MFGDQLNGLGTSWLGGEGPPRSEIRKKCTLFFEFFDLSDLYIFEHLSLHIHFQAFKPSYTFSWVRRVLWESKFENKWTLFFDFFDLSDIYIFEHLSLHIHFLGWGGSSQKQNSKINGLSFFELFDLSDHYIFEHLSLHINFWAFKPSYTFSSI